MTWIKLDDGFPNNPKILPLSDRAFRLYIEGLCYANQYLTDGFLTDAILRRLGDPCELLKAGVWVKVPEGVQIANYTEVSNKPTRPSQKIWAEIRTRIFLRDNFTCQYCGEYGKRLECDHILPVSRGGGHGDENLATACFACNRSKRNKLVDEWRQMQ